MAVTIPNQWSIGFGDTDGEIVTNPTTGRMLIAVIVSRVLDGSAPTLAVGDVSRNGWTLLADAFRFASVPHAAGQLQVEVWGCPSARFDGWPFALIYASAMQITASDVGSVAVNVLEIAGTTGQITVDSVTTATATASTTLAMTAPAPTGAANVLQIAAAVADVAYASYTTTGTGWTQLNNMTNGNPNVGLLHAWREATTTGSVTFTLAAAQNWAGVIVALKTAGTVLAQPNPAWPATSLQIGLGYDLSTPLSRVRWTDQTTRYLSLNSSRGIQAELGAAQAGQTVLKLRNHDGAYSPRPVASAATATATGTTTTVKMADASATSIHVADFFRLKTSGGAFKELNVFQVVSLASAAGTTTVTFARADGTAGGALAATATGDVYAGIAIDLYIPWRLLHTVAGITYVVASGWLRDLPLAFEDAHYSTVQAQGADAVETLSAENPSALRGEVYRRVGLYAYWPCDDSSGVTYAANASGVSNAPLTQTASKWGVGAVTAAFGTSTQGVTTNTTPQSLFGDGGTGWAQSGGVAADLATKGYALVGSDPGFPSIANGVTIIGSLIAPDPTNTILNATADPTVCMVRNADPAAGVGQGSVIKVSIDRPTLLPRVTVWDKNTHATTTVTGTGPVIAGVDAWRTWALTFNQTSWALYIGTFAVSASGSCNLVANWSGLDIGGEADQFNHGRTFPGLHAHIAVYGHRLTAQEITNWGYVVLRGGPLNEVSSARVSRKLNTVGWRNTRVVNNSVIYDSIEDTPSGTVADLLSTLASWEDSAAFADGAGQTQFRSRITAYQQHPVATLGDGPGEIPYQPGQIYDYNPAFIYNQTTVENSSYSSGKIGMSTLVAIDDISAAKYPGKTLQLATRLLFTSDAWHLGWWLLARYSTARQRVGTVTVSAAATADTARWAFVCGVEIGDVVTINRRPIGQPAISIRCKVLNVSPVFDRTIDPAIGQVTLTLAGAPFIVPVANDATYGVVGGTVLGA